MYIEPNTVIRLLKNCPLDNTYDHTIYFNSGEAQFEYFASLTKYTLTQQTYQRVNRSRMRVQYKADDLYDCNYLMFQNTNFGNKWFYAFIKSVEYVNNITSEIEYEIDVMQTWAFDYQLGQCFIDREHSATDTAGDNIIPENFELGEYVSTGVVSVDALNELALVVAATFDETYNDRSTQMYSGLFSGLYFNVFDNTPAGAILAGQFIQNAGAKSDGIVCVFLMPKSMVTPNGGKTPNTYEILINKFNELKRADGGDIKNNKLLTYPYNFLYCTNQQGNSAEYHYELFDGDICKLSYTGDMSACPSVIISPVNYKGVSGVNYDEKLVLSGFPELPYNVDAFKAWLAQNANSLAINALAAAGGAPSIPLSWRSDNQGFSLSGLDTRGAAKTLRNTGLQAAAMVGQIHSHSLMPHQARGGGGSSTFAALNILNFLFMHKHIQPQFVSVIDDYFNMYGYATHRVKVPNRNVRPYWTYTKTVGCVVHGSVPCDDMGKICSIFDNGITFWTNGANIGNYSLDNRPKGGTE